MGHRFCILSPLSAPPASVGDWSAHHDRQLAQPKQLTGTDRHARELDMGFRTCEPPTHCIQPTRVSWCALRTLIRFCAILPTHLRSIIGADPPPAVGDPFGRHSLALRTHASTQRSELETSCPCMTV